MARRISFGGQSIRIPGAYSQVDARALTPSVLGAFNRVGVIATSDGGVPQKVVTYRSPATAEQELIDGDLLNACNILWAPSPQTNGASEILVVRPEQAQQSESIIQDTGDNDAIKLTSRNYGSTMNNIRYALTTASDGYGKKIEIFDSTNDTAIPEQSFAGIGTAFLANRGNDDLVISFRIQIVNCAALNHAIDEFKDNLGVYEIYLETAVGNVVPRYPVGATIVVTGATNGANNATFVVSGVSYDTLSSRTKIIVDSAVVDELASPAISNIQEQHTIKTWADGVPEVDIDLTNQIYDTVYRVVEYVNSNFALYNWRIVGDSRNSRFLSARDLDSIDITGSAGSVNFEITSNIPLVVSWINNNSELVVAEVLPGASSLEPKNVVDGRMAGGANAIPTTQDWEDAINLFEAEDVQLMCIMTDDLGIQLALKNHIEYMSTQGRSERRGYFGHAVGESIADIKDRALALSSKRCMLLSPAVAFTVDSFGEPEIVSSAFLSAAVCGMVAGSSPQTPMTNKQVALLDVEKAYLDSELIDLLDAGVAPVKYDRVRGIFKVVQGQTTWLRDENTVYKEDSVGRIADYISLNVRRILEDRFVGEAAQAGTAEDIRITVVGLLREFAQPSVGLITNYGEVSVRIENTIAYIEYEVAPSDPINFILITTRFVPSRLVA